MLSIVNTLIPPDVSIVQILPEADKIVLIARPKNLVSYCPGCGYASRRVHSHYLRRFADLPWHGRVVEIHPHARRFRCDNLHCQRRIFTERLAETVQPRARRMVRLGESQREIGFATGGEPGSRLSRKLAMPVSGDTLLRMICRAAVEPFPPPRVVGIDDWAWRKGQRYGTIVCDLERNRAIDLLPDREAGTVAAWLKRYPGIEIVARDRAGSYADGASRGAPQARQVADRWHLLRNLGDALRKIADAHRRDIRAAWCAVSAQNPADHRPVPTRQIPRHYDKKTLREQRYQEMKLLYHQGVPINGIARMVGLGHHTVSRWLKAGGPPAHDKPRQSRLLDPFETILEAQWLAGCRSGTKLWRLIQAEGFTGTARTVRRWTKHRAEQDPVSVKAIVAASGTPISNRQCIRLLMASAEALGDGERKFVQELKTMAPTLSCAAELAKTFSHLMRTRDPAGFDLWLEQALSSELATFARGLRRDIDAVRAAFTEPWGTSPVEGQINRLKTKKRQMYGRAGYPLLRSRVLDAA